MATSTPYLTLRPVNQNQVAPLSTVIRTLGAPSMATTLSVLMPSSIPTVNLPGNREENKENQA